MSENQQNLKKTLKAILAVVMCFTVILFGLLSYLVLDTFFVEKTGGNAIIYPFPEGLSSSANTIVKINGQECFVFETNVNFRRQSPMGNAQDVLQHEKTPVASFDMKGKVTVSVTLPGQDIKTAKVTPLSLGIKPKIKGDTVTFQVSKPGQLTVEFNDSPKGALHLFANPVEENIPSPDDSNVIYFGPGLHEAGLINVKSGQTVYLAGGAIVRGWVAGTGVENVTIRGRGYFDGSTFPRYAEDGVTGAQKVPINMQNCKNITIDGISCLDPSGWAVNTYHCTDVVVNNVKIISSRQNGDGITTQSCTNQKVTNCFVRSWDDSLVVKAYEGDARDISFDNCIIWTDLAQSCEIGFETRGEVIENIRFSNITILHNFHKSVLSIHNGDRATVRNVNYENIVVEDAQLGQGDGWNFLIDILIDDSIWSKDSKRGRVENVNYNNIKVIGGNAAANRIKGYSSENMVKGVHIKDLVILDKKITSLKDGAFITNPYMEDVTFE